MKKRPEGKYIIPTSSIYCCLSSREDLFSDIHSGEGSDRVWCVIYSGSTYPLYNQKRICDRCKIP
jgi:hypothetical protein